ncbi:uncharacterized protein LOC126885875 isoform X1 [Diabrotica virgifera virgifera]|uniref:THAP-type domain-containing protein n=1 Tax=Diabrotica virgifera virgifera TaxID=50390 RepID=A0ABM5KEK7_DIAVI|nr:uncharacterized protein LOC126885875 isoform X1 [Diabrotica virgifera virgifera]
MENKSAQYKYCIVPGCKSTTVRTSNKHFFTLPKEPKRRLKWLKACRRDKKDISQKSIGLYVCEDHFDEDDIVYFENSDQSSSSKRKRSDSNKNESVNYDYESLKAEFKNEVQDAIRSNETLNYTTVREDEGIKDSFKSLIGQKMTRNCTEEERKGIGLIAVKCIWDDINKPKLGTPWLDLILRIILIWIGVYIIIAVPCWCQYGWCCCCCRCKFCKPQEQIEDAKQFFAQNPPGTFHDKDGNVVYYTPTLYEKYAQKELEDQLKNM